MHTFVIIIKKKKCGGIYICSVKQHSLHNKQEEINKLLTTEIATKVKKPLNTIPEAKNNRPDSTRIALQQFTGWQKRSKKKKKRWGKGWGVKIIPITPSHNKRSQVSREKKKKKLTPLRLHSCYLQPQKEGNKNSQFKTAHTIDSEGWLPPGRQTRPQVS